jgi:hypothetical protein
MGPPGPQGIPGPLPDGAPFLPLAGGTVSGPLNYTATGSTTMRSAQDRAGEVINVKDYGATGNGTTNDTTAIQAAANAVPANGATLAFPPGIYQINAAVAVKSRTTVTGAGATLRATAAITMLINQNNAARVLTDHDIIIRDLTFDYGTSGAGAGIHAIDMLFVNHVEVRNCNFQLRGAGNGTSMIGCYNTLTDGCTAYGFSNCAYDHWWGPQKARVTNCYAESAASVQMVNFNPDDSTVSLTGLVASELVVADNQFRGTGSGAIPIQLEPLGTGNSVKDVIFRGNTCINVTLAMRGAVTGAVVAGNIFDGALGGDSVIKSYPQLGGSPADLSITGNVIVNPATVSGNLAVIRVACDTAVIANNAVMGAATNSLDTAGNAPVVIGNYWSTAINSNASFGQSGNMRLPAGIDNTPIGSTTPAAGSFVGLAASDMCQFGYHNLDTVIGGQAANPLTATAGYLLVSWMAGAPTGVPTNRARGAALVYDTVNHKLWAYDNPASAWRGVVLT